MIERLFFSFPSLPRSFLLSLRCFPTFTPVIPLHPFRRPSYGAWGALLGSPVGSVCDKPKPSTILLQCDRYDVTKDGFFLNRFR